MIFIAFLALEGAFPLWPQEQKEAILPPIEAPKKRGELYRNHLLVDYYIGYYSQGEPRETLERALERARPFLPFIREQVRSRGLPSELVYLPLLESSYKTDAVSSSGATGLWQFMMNSIAPYDIRVNSWLDERRDFWKSTEAALEKLSYNYKETGDWYLAIGAYNFGLNGIKRALANNDVKTYWDLVEKELISEEAATYVAKLIALATVVENSEVYGLNLPLEEDPQWVRVPLKQSVYLKEIIKKIEIDPDLFLRANQELNHPVTPPAEIGYSLKIPSAYQEALIEVLKESEALMGFRQYTIQKEDTLEEISQWYALEEEELLSYNSGLSDRLRPGRIIYIPVNNPNQERRPGELSSYGFKSWTERYTIQKGDSLWKIAGHYKISPEELAAVNHLPLNSIITPGMILRVPKIGQEELEDG